MTKAPPELAELGIEEVRVLRPEPGDVIVFVTSKRLTMEQADQIREQAAALFETHRIAVLEDGMSVEVVRKGGEPK